MISRCALLPYPLLQNIRVSKEFFEQDEMNSPILSSELETEDEMLHGLRCSLDSQVSDNRNSHQLQQTSFEIDTPESLFQDSDISLASEDDSDVIREVSTHKPYSESKSSSLPSKSSAKSSSSVFNKSTNKSKEKGSGLKVEPRDACSKAKRQRTSEQSNSRKNKKMLNSKTSEKKKKRTCIENDDVIYSSEVSQDDDDDGGEYEVEKIVSRRKTHLGATEYLVKWLGYPWSDNTWEPLANLTKCTGLVVEFEEYVKSRGARGLAPTPTNSEDEDRDDDLISEEFDLGADRVPMKQFIEEFVKDNMKGVELNCLPDKSFADLQPKQQLTNFTVDDTIYILLHHLELKRVGFIPNYVFSTVYSHLNSVSLFNFRGPLQYIHRHSIGTCDYVLVACSTHTEGADPDTNHFVLGVICKNKQKVVVLDSLLVDKKSPKDEQQARDNIFKALGMFVILNFKAMKLAPCLEDWEFIYSKDCPQQRNNFDCGIYTVMNALYIMKNVRPPKDTLRPSILARSLISVLKKKYPDVHQFEGGKTDELCEKIVMDCVKSAADFGKEFEGFKSKIVRKAASNLLKSLPNLRYLP